MQETAGIDASADRQAGSSYRRRRNRPPLSDTSRTKPERRRKGARGSDFVPNNLPTIALLAVLAGIVIVPVVVWLAHVSP
jgi:hypothetical protein